MVFPSRPRIEILRNIFLLVFLVLIVTIIATPLIVRRGIPFLAEETLEAVLLFAQISLAWFTFRRYEKTIEAREREIESLEKEFQKREKELLETFAYLGKLNVQMSLVKSFLKKLKAPTSKKEAREYVDEILAMARTISTKDWITLRIINTGSLQTISEYWARSSPKIKIEETKIGNREIIDMAKDKELCNEKGYCVLDSASAGPAAEKAFLVFQEDEKVDAEVLDFLKAAVNQCGIIHSMLMLRNGVK